MATRFRCAWINYQGRRYNIYLDDADYVGSVIDFDSGADGFSLDYQGDNKGLTVKTLGSSLEFGMAIGETESNYTDCLALIDDLKVAAEGRFTVKVTRGQIGVDETLFWVGYVLPDIARLEDRAQIQEFRVAASDGLGRLKGIEYKDDSGATDVPYGMRTFKDHIIACLTEEATLSGLYFTGSDVFLRTVADWYETGHGTITNAKCPTAYSRVSGEVFAERNKDGGWKFKNCYEVLEAICLHWRARLYFSDGCYRFEQYNLRAEETFFERRFSNAGSLLSSTGAATYEELINQTHSGTRLATGVYEWLPAMKKAVVNYGHHTYKNYLAGTSYKWYKTSGSNDALLIENIGFDADSYIKISGILKLKVTSASTVPWRQVFALYLKVGDYTLKRHSQAVQPFYLLEYDTPAEWLISSVRADISTDFIFNGSFDGQVYFNIWTPVVPSGVDSISVDFDVYGAFDNVEDNVTTTISDWAFHDISLTIVGLDTAANYEADRQYYSSNSEAGNSFVEEVDHVFGHAVKPWTPGKIQVSSDGSAWADSTATWSVAGGATDFEFGQLAANETLAAQALPVQTYNGSMRGDRMFAHYRFTTGGDDLAWLFLSGRFEAQMETMTGRWWNCGTNRIFSVNGPVLQLPIGGHNPDTSGPFNPFSPITKVPTNNSTNIALNALTNNFTSAAMTAGAVTSVPVQYPVKANAYETGDEIIMVDPGSGKITLLTITANSAQGDTSLAVSGTLAEDLPLGSYLIYSSLNKTTTEGGASLPYYWEAVSGGHIRNVNTGAVRTQGLLRVGSVSGITPTTLIGRDANGDVGTVSIDATLTLTAGVLSAVGSGSGTVTSVGLSLPASIFDVSGSPVTTSGTLTATLDNQSANQVFAGPTTGSPATPAFRALVAGDIPNLDFSKITTGTVPVTQGGTGATSFTANQVLYGNGTSAVQSSANLTFDGTDMALGAGKVTVYKNAIFNNQNANKVTVGSVAGTEQYPGIWFGSAAPSLSNYAFLADVSASQTILNAPATGNISLRVNNSQVARITSTGLSVGTGSPTEALDVTGNVRFSGALMPNNLSGSSGQLLQSGGAGAPPTWLTPTYLTANQTITLSGDVTGSGTTAITTTIATNAVTDAKFRQSAALSVVGRSANSTGNVADIAAASDNQVLRRSGTTIGFGAVNLASSSAVTGTLPFGNGGTGLSVLGTALQMLRVNAAATALEYFTLSGLTGSLTATRVPFASGASALSDAAELTWDNTNKRLVIGSGASAAFLNVFAGALSGTQEFIRASANVNGNMINSLLNASNASTAANAIETISVGGAAAGDPMIQFVVSAVGQTTIGVDNSDADKFKITPGASVPGGTANRGLVVTNDATALVGVNKDAPAHPLDVTGRARANQHVQVQENPTVSFGSGAGTGASGSCLGGSNGFQITFTTGTTPAANSLIFTVTLLTAFPAVHQFVPGARNPQAATDLNKFYTSGFSASQISVTSNGTLAASTQYVLYYVGIGY